MTDNPHYFQLDELENGIDSLETAATFSDRSDTLKWKWIAFALHHALTSFCVASLAKMWPGDVISSGKRDDEGHLCQMGDNPWKKSRRAYVAGGPAYRIVWEASAPAAPEGDSEFQNMDELREQWRKRPLVGFWTLLARVQDPVLWMGRSVISRAVQLTDEEIAQIKWLHDEVRNELMHFKPKHNAISISGVKTACGTLLRVVEFIALESFTVYWRTEDERTRTQQAIAAIRAHMQKSES